LTFYFANLYAVSTLFGVLTKSPIAAILLTCLVWVVLYAVGWGYDLLEGVRRASQKGPEAMATDNPEEIKAPGQEGPPAPVPVIPQWVYTTVDTLHFILPRTSDLSALTSRLIIRGVLLDDNPRMEKLEKTPITWGESLTVSGVFIALMLGLSCAWFATRDY
jgi:hypothetical protein